MGQLNFSCAQRHDDNWGEHLGSAPIPQAHANAYPIYRLAWEGMGSLQRWWRNCMSGVRAQAFPYGAQEFAGLELYLAERASGLRVCARQSQRCAFSVSWADGAKEIDILFALVGGLPKS